MGDCVLKSPQRRQSLRIKGIKALYESQDAAAKDVCPRFKPQDALNSLSVGKQINVDRPILCQVRVDDVSDGDHIDKSVNVERDSDPDIMSVDNTTLKDLRARCKSNKFKILKTVSSDEVNLEGRPCHDSSKKWSHLSVKPKEEEPDLDEPLIIFKAKISKKMNSKRKRRCMNSSSDPPNLFKDRTDKVPVHLNVGAKFDLSEDNYVVVSNESTMHRTDALNELFMDTNAVIPESIHSVKCEIVENASPDEQETAYTSNVATKPTTKITANCDLHEQSSKLMEEVSRGDSEMDKSGCSFTQALQSCSSSHMNTVGQLSSSSSMADLEPNVDSSFSYMVCDVNKCEFLESDSSMQSKVYITGSAVDLMGSSNYTGKSTIANESERWNLTGSSIRMPQCSVDEEFTECFEDDGQACSPEHVGEPFFCHSSDSASISIAMDHHPSICGTREEHIVSPMEFIYKNTTDRLNHFAMYRSQESMGINGDADTCTSIDHGKLVEKVLAGELLTDGHISDAAVSTNMQTKQSDCSGHFSSSRIQGEQCDHFAREVCQIDVQTDHDECNIAHSDEHLVMEAYDLSSYEHSQTYFSAADDSHTASTLEIKNPTDNAIDQLLDDITWKKNYHAAAVSECIDVEASSSPAEKLSSDVGEGSWLSAQQLAEPSEIAVLVEAESNGTIDELKVNGGDLEHTPKKLLSNRKTISPTSQEKLYQALNGINLYDAMQLSKNRKRLFSEKWYKVESSAPVAGNLASEMKVAKRPKSDAYGSGQSAVKGILKKSPDNFGSMPCSCSKNAVIHKQSQEAIEFTQMQMKSMRSIVWKLLKGLNSLKDVVEESSEALSSASSRYTADEIRATLQNTLKLEASTKRFFSLMSKDCGRFCKIMSSAQKTASLKGTGKDGKSITFADEAGGRLCHVKVIEEEEEPTSFEASQSDYLEQ